MSRVLCVAALSAIGLFSFATAVRAAGGPATPATNTAQTTTTNPANVDQHDTSAMRPWRASETLGLRVENPQGEHLGKIEDLVFNPSDGHVRYAVLSFGGVLGIGQKWFAIPWKHLQAQSKVGTSGNVSFALVLDVDKSKLKNAPGFDSKQWPDFGNSAYGTSVDEFYETSTAAFPTTNTK